MPNLRTGKVRVRAVKIEQITQDEVMVTVTVLGKDHHFYCNPEVDVPRVGQRVQVVLEWNDDEGVDTGCIREYAPVIDIESRRRRAA